MEPQRLLARMNALTLNWGNSIPSTRDVLCAESIAAALAGLGQGPYCLMRYLWCHDDTVQQELYGLLLREVFQMAHNEAWGCKNNLSKLMLLIKTAIHDIGKVNLCKPCKGTGVFKNEICIQCNGVGHKKRSQADLAKSCGINPPNWRKHWAMRYHAVYLLVCDWNEKGLQHLVEKL